MPPGGGHDYEAGVAFKFNFGGGDADAAAPPPPPTDAHPRPPALEVDPEALPPATTIAYDAVDVGLSTPLLKARFDAAGGGPVCDTTASSSTTPVPATHDVVAGVYEGGAKLWEGGVDLARLLVAAAGLGQHGDAPRVDPAAPPLPTLTGTTVLELGAGAGLPGVVAALAGAASVAFADYNEGVLALTAATVEKARTRQDAPTPSFPPIRYFAGDWRDLKGVLQAANAIPHPAGGFDIILGAEVSYSPATTPTLAAALASLLHPTTGAALISSKRYYFGVGGGTNDLVAAVEGVGLSGRVVATADAGGAVPRDVVLVTRRR